MCGVDNTINRYNAVDVVVVDASDDSRSVYKPVKADDDYLGDNKYCLFGSRVILLLFDGCTGFGNNRFGSCYSVYYSSHIQEM